MKKQSSSKSGFITGRIVLGIVLSMAGISLAMLSFAGTPSIAGKQQNTVRTRPASSPKPAAPTPITSGTVDDAHPILTYSDGPFVVPNVTAQAGDPICTAPMSCSDFGLTVGSAIANPTTKQVRVSVSWPVSAADFDVYIYNGFPAAGSPIASSASSADPEVVILPTTGAVYTIRVVPFNPAGQTYTATITLETKPPAPQAGTAPPPRYLNYPPNPANLAGAGSAGEPSIGVDWNPNVASLKNGPNPPTPGTPVMNNINLNTGGVAFFTANLNEYRVNFDDCASPAKNLWEDVTNSTEGVTTLDPIGFVNHQVPGQPGTGLPFTHQLGRVFQSQLAGATSIMSFSDDDGNTWTQSQGSGQPAGVDHETVGGGPYAPTNTGVPPVVEPPHPLYPHQIYYASQDVGTAFAARSDNGGQTFGPGVPMWNISNCGGLHGHIKVGPDGTVYVPNKSCGAGTAVAVSRDNGLTWTVKNIHEGAYTAGAGDTDPSVGIGTDNTLYVGYQNSDGHPHIAVSTDHGDTWHDVDVSQGVIQNTVFPEVVAGDGDRAAFGFLGTSTGGGYQGTNTFTGVWYFYIATTFDRGQTYTLVDATNGDPVQVGSICTAGTTCGADRNLLDFNDLQIDAEGRVLAAYADGCVAPGCTAATATAHNPPYNESRSALSSVLRQSGGPRLLAAFDSQANCTENLLTCNATVPSAPRVDSVTQSSPGTTVHIAWSTPDNGGSALTGYKVYRKDSGTNTYAVIATVTTGCPACKSSYDDTTATNSSLQYTYKVTATNLIGESAFCGEFPVGLSGPLESPCQPPGITEVTDPSGDDTGMGTPAGADLLSLQVAQPYAPDGNIKLVFTINTNNGQSPQPFGSAWYVAMQIQHGSTTFYKAVRMAWKAPSTTPVFESYTPAGNTSGGVDGRFVTAGSEVPADPSSSYSAPFNKVILVVKASDLGVSPGDTINFISSSEQSTNLTDPGVGTGAADLYDSMPDGPSFSITTYVVNPNALCAPNTAPIAMLTANPLSGDPPLVVTFTPSGTDPNQGDTIASYTIDFGDGSAPATQNCAAQCPQIQHTYQSNGHFEARLTVKDNHGLVSSNVATAEIEVELPLDRVASRKAHGGVPGSPFEVILFDPSVYPNGNGEIECRAPGPENDYTIVFTFGSEFMVTHRASSVTVDGSTTNVNSDSFSGNTYTVHVKPTVPNAQHHTVTIDGVPVSNANKGGAQATLRNVGARFDLLIGDVNGTGGVDGNDVAAVQSHTRQPVNSNAQARFDVNATGNIDGNDVAITQSHTRTSLP
jgi:PKD domain